MFPLDMFGLNHVHMSISHISFQSWDQAGLAFLQLCTSIATHCEKEHENNFLDILEFCFPSLGFDSSLADFSICPRQTKERFPILPLQNKKHHGIVIQ